MLSGLLKLQGRRRFYAAAAEQLVKPSVPVRSPYDFEIGLLFLPALVAG